MRSYVLREGRLTDGQKRAFARHWGRYGLELEPGSRIDVSAVFGNDRPVIAEIGFGDGAALADAAAREPQTNFLGIEVHRPGIGRLLNCLAEANLENVRIARQDAMDLMRSGLAAGSLLGLRVFFPDPWPKKRHHKRRLVQEEFVGLAAGIVQKGGFVHMATDWEDYARQMMELMSRSPDFFNATGTGRFTPRPADRPPTKFERRGLSLGHPVWDLVFRRK